METVLRRFNLMARASQAPSEAKIRAELTREPVRRGSWIRIAGPLSALGLGVLAAALYLHPVGVLRWLQMTWLGWSGATQKEIALGDGLMTYLVTGGYAGMEPVLMIHGLGPSAALVWRDNIAALNDAHYKVVTPNLFGFAASEHKQVAYTIAYQAKAIAQLVDALKLDHVNLVAHGLGVDVALYYAVDHPDRVERLVLVSGSLIGSRGAARLRHNLLPANAEALRAQAAISFYGLPPLPDFMYERMMLDVAADLPAQSDMLNSVPRDEAHIRAGLGRIFNNLAVIIWGAQDQVLSPSYGEALHSLLPGSATAIFKGSGHWPQLEHPEEFADTLLFFLKQKEGGE